MQALRRAGFLVRLVLAMFALSLGVAIASPAVNPVSLDVVCSAGGVFKALPGGEPGRPASHHSLDCPLCATMAAPPAVAYSAVEPLGRDEVQPPPLRAGPMIVAVAAPLPGRGPPAR